APSTDARRALEEWARVRGVSLRAPVEEHTPDIAIDLGIADLIEKNLDRSRDALAALDVEATERALLQAEALVRAHPELPQAAWLRAEVERGWAARFLRGEPRDPARAERAWLRAAALDGGRAAGIGEEVTPGARSDVTSRLEVDAAPSAVIRVDGDVLVAADLTVLRRAEGEHQVVVSKANGQVTYASWISIGPGSRILIRIPKPTACTADDMESARGAKDGTLAVTCPSWVAASEGPRPGMVQVATCERNQCGSFVEWSASSPRIFSPLPVVSEKKSAWPGWATWATVGVGAVVVGTLTLYAAGVFDARGHDTRFVNGGVH
ncbi:MAG: hypothetical protein ABIP39_05120, partial [Polyangiaceae bacterium]